MEEDKKRNHEIPDEKMIKSRDIEEKEVITKNQVKSENKILKKVFIWLIGLSLIFIFAFLIFNSAKNFEYGGINFNVIKEGDVRFYHTSFPVTYEGKRLNYNVYLRNDPRKLENIPFNGELNLLKIMVINNTESFVCEGDGGIAMLNFQQILRPFGVELMKDPDATCDPEGRYMFVKIQPGNITSIEQTGQSCYDLNVNNCEILKVTERFIIEVLTQTDEIKEI